APRPPRRMSLERRENLPVELDPAVRRQRLLDGERRELVAERNGLVGRGEHPRGEAGLQLVEEVARNPLEEPELGLRRGDGDDVQRPAGARRRRSSPKSRRRRRPAGTRAGQPPWGVAAAEPSA